MKSKSRTKANVKPSEFQELKGYPERISAFKFSDKAQGKINRLEKALSMNRSRVVETAIEKLYDSIFG